MMDIERLKALLHLEPLPVEGGYFAQTYRSLETIPQTALPGRYPNARSFGAAIYYLLTPDTFSALHRLKGDEIYHFYLGDPVELVQLGPDGSGKVHMLGPDLFHGMQPQIVVPHGTWQGSQLRPGGRFALLGTTMAPGFEYEDFEIGLRTLLLKSHPRFKELILALTRES
jgi:predicted cupin superfamily sugar epimerase